MDKRTERSVASVGKLEFVLKEVHKDISRLDSYPGLRQALVTQGGLAKFQLPRIGIRAMSLNTLKRCAETTCEGGFSGLDKLRIACLRSGATAPIALVEERSDSRRVLQAKVQRLSERIQQLQEDMFFLSERLGLAMSQARVYAAEAGGDMQDRCRREQQELLRSLGLRPSAGDLNGQRSKK